MAEKLVSQYKLGGSFEKDRKQLLAQFQSDAEKKETARKLISQLVKLMLQRDGQLLSKNHAQVSALIQTELVKRHVAKSRDCASTTAPSSAAWSMAEINLLDNINALVDNYLSENIHSDQFQDKIEKCLKRDKPRN